ncbi:MAG: tetratricopeptide repeat protein [Acidobacteriota bacterium]
MSSFLLALALAASPLEDARDRQDASSLAAQISKLSSASSPAALYQLALAHSFQAEIAMEKGDKKASAASAEAGIGPARKAIAGQPNNSDFHRILGTLCGQIIPANVLAGLKYGRCALDEVSKAIELNPKSAANYLSRGVGNYYLPPSFGGGLDKAIADFDQALSLNPKLAEAHLWRGIALRKAGKNAEARNAVSRSLELNPKRLWAKTQLEKTPAQ